MALKSIKDIVFAKVQAVMAQRGSVEQPPKVLNLSSKEGKNFMQSIEGYFGEKESN